MEVVIPSGKVGLMYFDRISNSVVRIIDESNKYITFYSRDKPVTIEKRYMRYHFVNAYDSIGVITISVVQLGQDEDVIVVYTSSSDLINGKVLPSIVARVIFTQSSYPEDRIPIGICVTGLSDESDYLDLLSYDRILSKMSVWIYLNDNLDSVISIIPKHFRYKCDSLIYKYRVHFDPSWQKYLGSDLETFLLYNGFMDEIDIQNSVNHLDFYGGYIPSTMIIDHHTVNALEQITTKEILNINNIIEYTPNFNLDQLSSDDFMRVRNNKYESKVYLLKLEVGGDILIVSKDQEEFYKELLGKF